jgi:hypothetical protein
MLPRPVRSGILLQTMPDPRCGQGYESPVNLQSAAKQPDVRISSDFLDDPDSKKPRSLIEAPERIPGFVWEVLGPKSTRVGNHFRDTVMGRQRG